MLATLWTDEAVAQVPASISSGDLPAPCRNSCGADDVGSLGDRAGAGWIWLDLVGGFVSFAFKQVFR